MALAWLNPTPGGSAFLPARSLRQATVHSLYALGVPWPCRHRSPVHPAVPDRQDGGRSAPSALVQPDPEFPDRLPACSHDWPGTEPSRFGPCYGHGSFLEQIVALSNQPVSYPRIKIHCPSSSAQRFSRFRFHYALHRSSINLITASRLIQDFSIGDKPSTKWQPSHQDGEGRT